MSTPDLSNEWSEVKPLSKSRELGAILMFVKRDFLQKTHFLFAFFAALVATAFPLLIYGIMAKFGQSVPELQGLAGGFVNYVISGMVINTLLAAALSGPYSSLLESFWSNRLEIIMASPLRLPVFVTGLSAGRYVDTLIRIFIYLTGATLFLGFTWPTPKGLLVSLIILIPALAACTGLGLAAASSFYTLDARGGQDPIRFVVETIAGLISGVYFPLQMLPTWAQWLAHLVPHTYALDGIRRAAFGDSTIPLLPIHKYLPVPPLAADCLILCIYALVVFPVGWRLLRYGVQLARQDGRLSRWS